MNNNITKAQQIDNELDTLVASKNNRLGVTNAIELRGVITEHVCDILGREFGFKDELTAEQIEDLIHGVHADLMSNKLAELAAIKAEQRINFNPSSGHWLGDKAVSLVLNIGASVAGMYIGSKVFAGKAAVDPLAKVNDAGNSMFADTFAASPRPSRKHGTNVLPFDQKAS